MQDKLLELELLLLLELLELDEELLQLENDVLKDIVQQHDILLVDDDFEYGNEEQLE